MMDSFLSDKLNQQPVKYLATLGFFQNYQVKESLTEDGSIGFLHVREEFRKRGIGQQILLDLIRQNRALKRPVFGNVLPENKDSKRLLEKLGFKFDCRMSWIKLK